MKRQLTEREASIIEMLNAGFAAAAGALAMASLGLKADTMDDEITAVRAAIDAALDVAFVVLATVSVACFTRAAVTWIKGER